MTPIHKIIGMAVLLFGVVVGVAGLLLANAHLKTQLAEAQRDYAACHIANDQFATDVSRQNKLIAQWKNENNAREKAAILAQATAQKQTQVFQLRIKKLSATKISGDDCQSANQIINAYLEPSGD